MHKARTGSLTLSQGLTAQNAADLQRMEGQPLRENISTETRSFVCLGTCQPIAVQVKETGQGAGSPVSGYLSFLFIFNSIFFTYIKMFTFAIIFLIPKN